jgi:dTDP-glucose 4,6-dehydratase
MNNRSEIMKVNGDLWSALKDKNIYLTGGTGYFGKSFLDLLITINKELKLNCNITILTRNKTSFVQKFPLLIDSSFIDFQEGDVCQIPSPQKNYEYVLHFASPASAVLNRENPDEVYKIIVEGTKEVLNFSKKCKAKKILFASSGAVYGVQPSEISSIPENFTGAPNKNTIGAAYGLGKIEAEKMGIEASQKEGIEFKIARCFAFAGPYLDPHGTYALGNFVRDAAMKKDIMIKGDGRDYRSYMSSDDLVVALLKVLILGRNKQAYNVGSDEQISIKDLALTVKQEVNPNIEIEIQGTVDESVPPKRYIPNIDLLKNELNYKPTMTLVEAIKVMGEYYKKILS